MHDTEARLYDLLTEARSLLSKKHPATRHDLHETEARLSQLILSSRCRKQVHFDWGVGLVTQKTSITESYMDLKLSNEQKVSVTLKPVTDGGKPVSVQNPTWEVISGDSTVVAGENGLSAVITSSDNPGDTQILVKADADLGEGVEEISDVIRLSVVGAAAKNLGITAGAPELK